jgi:putative transcriptional regulator
MPPKSKDTETPGDNEETEGTRIVVKLDDLLYERRMTLTELAERIGITLANLSILKTGKAKAMRFSTLEAICRELGCQPGDLLGYDAQPTSE